MILKAKLPTRTFLCCSAAMLSTGAYAQPAPVPADQAATPGTAQTVPSTLPEM